MSGCFTRGFQVFLKIKNSSNVNTKVEWIHFKCLKLIPLHWGVDEVTWKRLKKSWYNVFRVFQTIFWFALKKKIQDLELCWSLETIEFISLNYLKLLVSFTQFSDWKKISMATQNGVGKAMGRAGRYGKDQELLKWMFIFLLPVSLASQWWCSLGWLWEVLYIGQLFPRSCLAVLHLFMQGTSTTCWLHFSYTL